MGQHDHTSNPQYDHGRNESDASRNQGSAQRGGTDPSNEMGAGQSRDGTNPRNPQRGGQRNQQSDPQREQQRRNEQGNEESDGFSRNL